MLLEYGFKNFFSFKEGMVVSFKLDDNCPKSISQDCSYTNVLCVKGANGSGKTNVLKALSVLADFATNSFSKKPEEDTDFRSFFHNSDPSEFYIELMSGGTLFRYELVVNNKEVISEALYKKEKRKILLVKRESNKFIKLTQEYETLKIIKLRSNASFISTAHQYEMKEILFLYDFFNLFFCNVNKFGLFQFEPNVDGISKFYADNPQVFQFVNDFIKKCDIGIESIMIQSRKDAEDKDVYFPIFKYLINNQDKYLNYHTQSSGTKAMYTLVGLYQIVLDSGGVLVLDEFDINLHPHILPLIVGLFTDKEINTKGAQLVFTTHNTEIMDVLGRYRTILVNKEHNESYGYRLDEITGDIIRNDRPISPAYNAGKIGGVPHVG